MKKTALLYLALVVLSFSCKKDRNIDNFIAVWTTEYFVYEDLDKGVEAGYAKTFTTITEGEESNTINFENWESPGITVVGTLNGNKVKIKEQSYTYEDTPFYIFQEYDHPITIEYSGKGSYYFEVLEVKYTIKHYNAETGDKIYEAEAKHRSIMPQ